MRLPDGIVIRQSRAGHDDMGAWVEYTVDIKRWRVWVEFVKALVRGELITFQRSADS